MENLNKVVAKNIIKYRTLSGMTQVELAEKINYSDKSVSKWERGDSIPDLSVLVKLTEIFGININDFLDESTDDIEILPKEVNNRKRMFISLLAVGLTWFIASIVYVALFLVPATKSYSWMTFIYAIPISAIVMQVFSAMWGNQYTNVIASSLILWGLILSVCISFRIHTIWILCVAGGIFEILIIIWFMFRKFIAQKISKKNN